jgi:hypothetical protein
VPSGHDVLIEGGVLRLVQPGRDLTHRIIDRFLISLASDRARTPPAPSFPVPAPMAQTAPYDIQGRGLVLVQKPRAPCIPACQAP